TAAGREAVSTRASYGSDAVLRRAAPLQAHPLSRGARIVLNPEDAQALGLEDGAIARVDDGRGKAGLPLETSVRVPRGAAWIEKGYAATAPIAGSGASLTVTRA
ncbi:MAG: NADH-quinone oxidoreductase subunit G, partial [Gammaproteobacteria bacterium]|nr:NADH-quinone oxidoreductase subunit G [Gammaproteobacteria bacterium]